MGTFDTVEGQNKAAASASIKDYVDRMSLSELRKVENFISDLRQTDCSQSELIDGLVDLVVGLNLTALRLHEKNVENPKLGKEYSWNLRANILEDFAKAIECSIEKGS